MASESVLPTPHQPLTVAPANSVSLTIMAVLNPDVMPNLISQAKPSLTSTSLTLPLSSPVTLAPVIVPLLSNNVNGAGMSSHSSEVANNLTPGGAVKTPTDGVAESKLSCEVEVGSLVTCQGVNKPVSLKSGQKANFCDWFTSVRQ